MTRLLKRLVRRWIRYRVYQPQTRRNEFQPLHWDSPIRKLRMTELAARKAGV